MWQEPLSGWWYLAYNRILQHKPSAQLDDAEEVDLCRLCGHSIGLVWTECMRKTLVRAWTILSSSRCMAVCGRQEPLWHLTPLQWGEQLRVHQRRFHQEFDWKANGTTLLSRILQSFGLDRRHGFGWNWDTICSRFAFIAPWVLNFCPDARPGVRVLLRGKPSRWRSSCLPFQYGMCDNTSRHKGARDLASSKAPGTYQGEGGLVKVMQCT